jgi:hypothetical protein
MPATRAATVSLDSLPSIATVAEVAAFERVDERTIRKALEAGEIPGAFRRGRSWRVVTAVYLRTLSSGLAEATPVDSSGRDLG